MVVFVSRRSEIPVSEAARRLGVSRQRILQRLKEGSLSGEKVGSQWLVELSSVTRGRPARPLSPRMGWSLVAALSGDDWWEHLAASEKSRTRERVSRLRSLEESNSTQLLRAWLKAMAEVFELEAHPDDIRALREDGRLVFSGISDPRSRLSSTSEIEAYISDHDLKAFAEDHFLDLSAQPEQTNVTLRVVREPWLIEILDNIGDKDGERLAPLPFTIADLADRPGAREKRAATELMGELWLES